jgi:hypothetical protein
VNGLCVRAAGAEDIVRPALDRALLGGPSTSPLESTTKTHLESHEEWGARAEDPSLGASLVRVQLAAASLEGGARANADSTCSSRARVATRQARSGLCSQRSGALNGRLCRLGLLQRNRARTVAPMKASSNHRWSGP